MGFFSFSGRDIKKLYFNLYVSFNSMNFPLRTEVVCHGSDDVYSFCRALKGGEHPFYVAPRVDSVRMPGLFHTPEMSASFSDDNSSFPVEIFTFSSSNNILQLCY